MRQTTPNTMQVAAIDRFGGIETITPQTLPVPQVGPDEVLIRVESAGVGVWDPFEREGGFAAMLGIEPKFPYVLGTDGAGTVAAVGEQVSRFKEGDRVYAAALANPKGGFYAEYAAVKADNVSHVPAQLTTEQAGVMACDAMTALRGLDDMLGLKPGEALMIFGASGGIGHLAVQLAQRLGARVLAVASGADGVALARRLGADAVVNGRTDDVAVAAREFAPDGLDAALMTAGGEAADRALAAAWGADGVALARRLGADVVVNGRTDDVAAAARAFAPEGLDAALMTAGGEAADRALAAVRAGGRVAYPNGVMPEPKVRPEVRLSSYDVIIDQGAIDKLNRLIDAGPFEVHVARTFRLDQAAEAHRALAEHYLGKLALRPS